MSRKPPAPAVFEALVLTEHQLAQALRAFRKHRALTQREVATRSALFPKTISSLETQPNRATVNSLFKVLAALNVELVLRDKAAAAAASAREEQ